MQKQVIFNADDFGLTRGVNRGILKAYSQGVVRSTSLMVNLPDAEDYAKTLKEQANLNTGLHVNLTYGKPVLDAEQVPSLVDDSGIFWRRPASLMEFADFGEIEKEIRAQMELVLKMGMKLTHLDSHHHLHQFAPPVTGLLIELAKRHKLAIRSVDDNIREAANAEGIPTTDHFAGDFYGEKNITIEKLEKIITSIPAGTTEIMCHPGFDDGKLENVSSYTHEREKEVDVLTSNGVLQLLQKYQVKLIGFGELLDFLPGFERK